MKIPKVITTILLCCLIACVSYAGERKLISLDNVKVLFVSKKPSRLIWHMPIPYKVVVQKENGAIVTFYTGYWDIDEDNPSDDFPPGIWETIKDVIVDYDDLIVGNRYNFKYEICDEFILRGYRGREKKAYNIKYLVRIVPLN